MMNYQKLTIYLKNAIKELRKAEEMLGEFLEKVNVENEVFDEYNFEREKIREIEKVIDEIEDIIYELKWEKEKLKKLFNQVNFYLFTSGFWVNFLYHPHNAFPFKAVQTAVKNPLIFARMNKAGKKILLPHTTSVFTEVINKFLLSWP